MITTREDLEQYMRPLLDQENRICAVDTEADSLYRYAERLCLIQISDGKRHELVDPLAIEDLSILSDYLTSAKVWMHGADYDMTMLQRSFDVIPPVVYDTQVGARLLGQKKFGYGNLVEDYLGVALEKSSQKADWGKRPLTEKMTKYALNDVIYLFPLADKIESGLREKGRYDWFVESCEAARNKVMNRDPEKQDPWRINGCGRLSPRGLSFLKALWYWRDVEASEWDRPSFMVITNKELIKWSEGLAEGRQPKVPERYRSIRRKRLRAALDAAQAESKDQWPEKPRGKRRCLDDDFENRVAALQKIRDGVAQELELDPSLIASRSTMESLCLPQPEQSSEELLLNWQRNLLGL